MKLTRRSLTLIELLLVLTIMAALAASAASFVEQADDQLRYQDTQNRLSAIREAILGSSAGGRAKHEGFLADMGRYPGTLSELLAPPDPLRTFEIDPSDLIVVSAANPGTGLGFGWRGPYLRSLPALGGAASYPDGWGNRPASGAEEDFGWKLDASAAPDFLLQSLGRDGAEGALPADDPYAGDYPATPLVVLGDHSVVFPSGVSFTVQIVGAPSLGSDVNLRIRYFEDNGGAPRLVALISDTATVPASPAGEVHSVGFTFQVATSTRLPCGQKAVDLLLPQAAPPNPFHPGTGNGGYLPVPGLSVQRVELHPRALPATLPVSWILP